MVEPKAVSHVQSSHKTETKLPSKSSEHKTKGSAGKLDVAPAFAAVLQSVLVPVASNDGRRSGASITTAPRVDGVSSTEKVHFEANGTTAKSATNNHHVEHAVRGEHSKSDVHNTSRNVSESHSVQHGSSPDSTRPKSVDSGTSQTIKHSDGRSESTIHSDVVQSGSVPKNIHKSSESPMMSRTTSHAGTENKTNSLDHHANLVAPGVQSQSTLQGQVQTALLDKAAQGTSSSRDAVKSASKSADVALETSFNPFSLHTSPSWTQKVEAQARDAKNHQQGSADSHPNDTKTLGASNVSSNSGVGSTASFVNQLTPLSGAHIAQSSDSGSQTLSLVQPNAHGVFKDIVSGQVNANQNSVTVQLHPVGLGSITITVNQNPNHQLSVQVQASNEQGFQWFNQERSSLANVLQSSGFQLSNFQISYGQGGQQQSTHSFLQQQLKETTTVRSTETVDSSYNDTPIADSNIRRWFG